MCSTTRAAALGERFSPQGSRPVGATPLPVSGEVSPFQGWLAHGSHVSLGRCPRLTCCRPTAEGTVGIALLGDTSLLGGTDNLPAAQEGSGRAIPSVSLSFGARVHRSLGSLRTPTVVCATRCDCSRYAAFGPPPRPSPRRAEGAGQGKQRQTAYFQRMPPLECEWALLEALARFQVSPIGIHTRVAGLQFGA